jgi:hypothetical protein
MDALRLRSKKLNTTPLVDGQDYVYDATSGELKPAYRPILLTFGNVSTSNTPATEYLDPGGGGRAATGNEPRLYLPPGKIWKLRVSARTGPTGGTITVTFRKNGTDQLLTATLAIGGNAVTDLTDSFTTVEGDWISVKAVSNTGLSAGAIDLYVTAEQLLSA